MLHACKVTTGTSRFALLRTIINVQKTSIRLIEYEVPPKTSNMIQNNKVSDNSASSKTTYAHYGQISNTTLTPAASYRRGLLPPRPLTAAASYPRCLLPPRPLTPAASYPRGLLPPRPLTPAASYPRGLLPPRPLTAAASYPRSLLPPQPRDPISFPLVSHCSDIAVPVSYCHAPGYVFERLRNFDL
jgi:hypothetical protein